ncbi:Alpha-L-fucosidase 2 [Vanrija pseudolonga]|uniref:Alpha-L-fucosidase 2 n=1 Tax=Vanrija pseudolonga TaxID=143232 RepID=A0AAF0Y9M3_9TREE|nr:Alpha-L-fucosidase 2 [Vanrija pseudolonga]
MPAPTPLPALTYDRPASLWVEALPLGNGSLGAMVYGDPWDERIALNESTLWSGSPLNESNAAAAIPASVAQPALLDARVAVLDRRYDDATKAVEKVQGPYSQAFLPLGTLRLRTRVAGEKDKGTATGYTRALDLDTATHVSRYELDGRRVRWTSFASHPDNALVVRLESEVPLDIDASFDSELKGVELDGASPPGRLVIGLRAPSDCPPPHEPTESVKWSEAPGEAMRAAAVLGWTHDGEVGAAGGLSARGVTRLTLVLAAQTTFVDALTPPGVDAAPAAATALARVDAALADVEATAARHLADYTALYARSALSLPGAPLHATLYNYGRYLLIAGSRTGAAMNLQGLWNKTARPVWSSNYTININTQMNYWAAEAVGLGELAEPLFGLIDALATKGKTTAQRLYGTRGWVAHHNTDVWAYSSPVGMGHSSCQWAWWPFAGPWLCLALVERVRFGNREFAARAWGPVRDAMAFVLDWVFEHDGVLITAPSTSPENTFTVGDDATRHAVTRSATMDISLATELGRALLEIAEAAGTASDPIVAETRAFVARLPRISPGSDGLLPEWAENHAQAEAPHRHMSHLVGVYPGNTIRDADQLAAAGRGLDEREDDLATGWALAWKVSLRARLRDVQKIDHTLSLITRDAAMPEHDDEVYEGSAFTTRGGLYPNLFSTHPPFQIDGNLGYVAGVAECLLQSQWGVISLLPALPTAWNGGRVSGLIARPGVRVGLEWEGRRLVEARLEAVGEAGRGRHVLELGGVRREVELGKGVLVLRAKDFEEACSGW